jgi:HSP20 family molecular chaperone IbpA
MPYALRAWQLGEICLTTKRILFLKNSGKVFEVDINSIYDIAIEKRKFILVKKDVIKLLFEKKNQILSARFITPNVHAWFEYLSELIPKTPRIIVSPPRSGASRLSEANRKTKSSVNEVNILKCGEKQDDKKVQGQDGKMAKGQDGKFFLAPLPSCPLASSFLMRQLEPDCEEILNYLMLYRHAKIDQLAELIDAPTHTSVLLKIRKNINPTAQKVLGQPILTFEESKIDPITGENVVFSWWLADLEFGMRNENGKMARWQDGKMAKQPPAPFGKGDSSLFSCPLAPLPLSEILEEPQVDVFDEGNHILIVVDLAGATEDDIRLEVVNNNLVLSAATFSKKYHVEIPFPASAFLSRGGFVDDFKTNFSNGILSIIIEKEANEDE